MLGLYCKESIREGSSSNKKVVDVRQPGIADRSRTAVERSKPGGEADRHSGAPKQLLMSAFISLTPPVSDQWLLVPHPRRCIYKAPVQALVNRSHFKAFTSEFCWCAYCAISGARLMRSPFIHRHCSLSWITTSAVPMRNRV
jgi:hypothetical protein